MLLKSRFLNWGNVQDFDFLIFCDCYLVTKFISTNQKFFSKWNYLMLRNENMCFCRRVLSWIRQEWQKRTLVFTTIFILTSQLSLFISSWKLFVVNFFFSPSFVKEKCFIASPSKHHLSILLWHKRTLKIASLDC